MGAKVYKDRLTIVTELKFRRAKMIANLQQPERYGVPVPTQRELELLTDDQLLDRVAQKFKMTREEAADMMDENVRDDIRWEAQQRKQKDREAARLARRPSESMTLEQALARAQALEKERMELVAFINTIPEFELDNVERLTGMWVRPSLNSDSGYTASKLIKIFKIILNGRRDPAALQAKLDAISR